LTNGRAKARTSSRTAVKGINLDILHPRHARASPGPERKRRIQVKARLTLGRGRFATVTVESQPDT
jgi:hypothetical protein